MVNFFTILLCGSIAERKPNLVSIFELFQSATSEFEQLMDQIGSISDDVTAERLDEQAAALGLKYYRAAVSAYGMAFPQIEQ